MNTRIGWIRIAALAALVVSCTQSDRDKEDLRCNVLPLNNRTLSPAEVQQQRRADIQRSILVLSNETAHVQTRIGQLRATIVSNKNCLLVETNEAERTRLSGMLTTSEHHFMRVIVRGECEGVHSGIRCVMWNDNRRFQPVFWREGEEP